MTDGNIELTRRKILASAGAIGIAGAGAGLGTSAFFSDEESFENNQLTAGELDMKVAWSEHYSDWLGEAEQASAEMPGPDEDPSFRLPAPEGNSDADPIELVLVDADGDNNPANDFLNATREESQGGFFSDDSLCGTDADVPDEPLIELDDVKPGDFGFGLFRFQLCTNPGYVWLTGGLESAMENGLSEPEDEDPDEVDGVVELLDEIRVAVGVGTTRDLSAGQPANPLPEQTTDSVPEPAETLSLREFLYLLEIGDGLPLDGDIDAEQGGGTGRDCFAGETEHYVSVVWWLPIDHGNQVQTDKVTFDLGFYTEQCRHNDGGDLIAYYPLDSVEDDSVEDLSGRGNDGTVNGVSSADGKVRDAGSFDGTDDYITVDFGDGSEEIFENWTVSGWINPSDWSDGTRKEWLSVSEDRTTWRPLDFVHESGAIKHYRGQAAGEVMSHDVSGETGWHHMLVTQKRVDATTVELAMYFDGSQVATTSGDYENMRPSEMLYLGRIAGNNPDRFYWDGRIDDVRIYDRVLDASEIDDLAGL